MKKNAGFTLIELMISLTLGLIVVAITIQLFISGQSNFRIQEAAATIQDSGVFSLNAVVKNIRLANYGNTDSINDQTLYGGIVLSTQTKDEEKQSTNEEIENKDEPAAAPNSNLKDLKIGSVVITDEKGISQDAYTDSGFDTTKSDQLVIIYQAPIQMTTCTGRTAQGSSKTINKADGAMILNKGWYVIERYYIKKNPTTGSADLYCSDAMFLAKGEVVPIASKWATTETLDQNYLTLEGQLVAPNVDYMRVQLIVKNLDKSNAVMSIGEYKRLGVAEGLKRPSIIGLNLSWLIRSSEKLKNLDSKTYQVLDQDLTPPDDHYMRHVYSATIALRNGGLGVEP